MSRKMIISEKNATTKQQDKLSEIEKNISKDEYNQINLTISIESKDNNQTFQTTATHTDKTLTYQEDDALVTFDYDSFILIRKTNEYTLTIYFNDKHPYLSIEFSDLDQKMSLPVKTKSIKKTKTSLQIKYSFAKENYTYKIELANLKN